MHIYYINLVINPKTPDQDSPIELNNSVFKMDKRNDMLLSSNVKCIKLLFSCTKWQLKLIQM